MGDDQLEEMALAFFHSFEVEICKEIGQLKSLDIDKTSVIFNGSKCAKEFNRKEFEQDLIAMNKEGMQ